MTNEEHEKLVEAHGPADTALMIEHLSDYKASKGKHYDDDYRTILSWVVRWLQEQKAKALKTGGAPRVANAPAPMEQSQETKTEQERRISENERWMREYLDEAKEKQ
jgi:hypothetical protein